jgi:hypothetical protein
VDLKSVGIVAHRDNVTDASSLICARPARAPESLDDLDEFTHDPHATKLLGSTLVSQRLAHIPAGVHVPTVPSEP